MVSLWLLWHLPISVPQCGLPAWLSHDRQPLLLVNGEWGRPVCPYLTWIPNVPGMSTTVKIISTITLDKTINLKQVFL